MLRCSVGRGKNSSSGLPLIDVRARAGLEDHAGDGGLALAGRAVARAGGEVDRRRRDRLRRRRPRRRRSVGSLVVAVLAVARTARRRRSPSRTMSTSRSAPGIAGLTRGVSSTYSSLVGLGLGGRPPSAGASAAGSVSGLLGGASRRAGASARRGLLASPAAPRRPASPRARSRAARSFSARRGRRLGHSGLDRSIGCGCCAACGWSGPA